MKVKICKVEPIPHFYQKFRKISTRKQKKDKKQENNMFFDTHAHYDDDKFDADRDAVLAAMPEGGVDLIVNPGCTLESSRTAVALASRWGHVYAAVGIHPGDCAGTSDADLAALRALAAEPKVVAIGEIGLDYYWEDNPPREEQQAVFRRQLELFFAIFDDWGFTKKITAFASPCSNFGTPEENAEFAEILKSFGILHWKDVWSDMDGFADVSRGLICEKCIVPIPWDAYAVNPAYLPLYYTENNPHQATDFTSHWTNYIRFNPENNMEFLSAWLIITFHSVWPLARAVRM